MIRITENDHFQSYGRAYCWLEITAHNWILVQKTENKFNNLKFWLLIKKTNKRENGSLVTKIHWALQQQERVDFTWLTKI